MMAARNCRTMEIWSGAHTACVCSAPWPAAMPMRTATDLLVAWGPGGSLMDHAGLVQDLQELIGMKVHAGTEKPGTLPPTESENPTRAGVRRRPAGPRYTGNMDWSLCAAVDRNPEKVGGQWCFRGTRLPVVALFEHLDRGSTIDEFLEWFPSVSREQVHHVLEFAKSSLEAPAAVA